MRSITKTAASLASLALVAGVASAQPKDYVPKNSQLQSSLDKVEMTGFVCEPSPIPPGTAQVTLKITVKNVSNGGGAAGFVLNGQKIRLLRTSPSPDVLELETTIVNLAPGVSQTVGARVNVAPGVREYFARVDPDDTLHEPFAQRVNNEKRLKLTIPQAMGQREPAPGAAPQMETQLLDYQKAKNAGAQFSNGVEGTQGGCGRVGQYDSAAGWSINRSPGVVFLADCRGTPNGVRATPEAFAGFHLKNGWKIKDYSIGENLHGESSDWHWRQVPTKGTDDPSMRVHLWAGANAEVNVQVMVTIEGPAGTNPYQ